MDLLPLATTALGGMKSARGFAKDPLLQRNAMKEGLLGGTLSVSPRSELEEARRRRPTPSPVSADQKFLPDKTLMKKRRFKALLDSHRW